MTTELKEFSPFKTAPKFAQRIWGRTSLVPWYKDGGTDKPVGEAWLTGGECVAETGEQKGRTVNEITGEFPLLVKILFPDDKLSVQVHPDDAQAKALGLPCGKTECWYVLAALPGAEVACGLKSGTGLADVEAAIEAGTLESLLNYIPVEKGDMIYVDAGTVHAIGAGATLLEVQQACDVTYRLYDYGRDRQLQVVEGLAVVKTSTKAGKVKPKKRKEFTRLIETEFFVVDCMELPAGLASELAMDGVGCFVGLEGAGAVNEVTFGVGEAVLVPDGSVTVTSVDGCTFLRCYQPETDEDQ